MIDLRERAGLVLQVDVRALGEVRMNELHHPQDIEKWMTNQVDNARPPSPSVETNTYRVPAISSPALYLGASMVIP